MYLACQLKELILAKVLTRVTLDGHNQLLAILNYKRLVEVIKESLKTLL